MAQAGVYSSTRWNAGYFSAALASAWHRVATDRTVTIAGTDRLTGDFDARALGARLEGGWRFEPPGGLLGPAGLSVTPYAALQLQSVHTDAYAERATVGSNAFALAYTAQAATDTRSELGAWADTRRALENGNLLTLRGRTAWVHDFNPDRSINAVFQVLPGAAFTVNGAAAPRNAALTSAVAELKLRNGVVLSGRFDGEFGSHSSTYAGTGTVRYAW